jgi:hypothetical protein
MQSPEGDLSTILGKVSTTVQYYLFIVNIFAQFPTYKEILTIIIEQKLGLRRKF